MARRKTENEDGVSLDETTDVATVEAKVAAEYEQGFRGVEVDKTPNENYTLAGVVAGLPTPETGTAAEQVASAHGIQPDLSGE